MNELWLSSDSPDTTFRIASSIGITLEEGSRIALLGPLGAGKTCFTQGLVAGLDCPDVVRSPSYVLVNEYEGRHPIYHCDWYRLETDGDVESTGFEDMMRDDSVVIVEWADRLIDWLPPPRLEVVIDVGEGDTRDILLRDVGGAYGEAIEAARARMEAW